MKKWEKLLWIWFAFVLLVVLVVTIQTADKRIKKRFSTDPLVTQTRDNK